MSSPALVPMFAPDGTLGDVPADRVQDALSRGFKQGVNVISRDGQSGVIPADRLQDAIRQGILPQGATTPRRPLDDRTGIQRFFDSAVIPRQVGTMSDVATALKNIAFPQASPTDPGFGQTLPVVGPIFRAQRETYDQPGAAAKAYGLIPVVGPAGYRAGQQLEKGDYDGAAGSAINIITQMLGFKSTNLASNIGDATQEAGNLTVKAAPAVGNAANIGTLLTSGAEAYKTGQLSPLLAAFLHRRVGALAERATSNFGSVLQKVGAAINPDVPSQFGNPAFSSASIVQDTSSPIVRNAPIRGGSQVVQTFQSSTPEEIAANNQRIQSNIAARQQARTQAQPVQDQASLAQQQPVTAGIGAAPSERTLSGESALRQVLTGQDNANLMRIAKSRGINVTKEGQLKPGVADKLLVEKIINDFSPDELGDVSDKFLQAQRFSHNFGDIGPEAGNTLDVQTYFPNVKLPAAVLKRLNAAISQAKMNQVPQVGNFPAQTIAPATDATNLESLLTKSIAQAKARANGAR